MFYSYRIYIFFILGGYDMIAQKQQEEINASKSFLEKIFNSSERGSTLRNQVLVGITIF